MPCIRGSTLSAPHSPTRSSLGAELEGPGGPPLATPLLTYPRLESGTRLRLWSPRSPLLHCPRSPPASPRAGSCPAIPPPPPPPPALAPSPFPHPRPPAVGVGLPPPKPPPCPLQFLPGLQIQKRAGGGRGVGWSRNGSRVWSYTFYMVAYVGSSWGRKKRKCPGRDPRSHERSLGRDAQASNTASGSSPSARRGL